MTKTLASLIFALAALAALAPCAATAHDSHPAARIEIIHAWAPVMSAPDANSALVFMTVKNYGPASDRLIRVFAPVAGKVEIHEIGDAPKSVGNVAVEVGKDLEFGDTGHQMVLTGLKRPLALHERFKMALEFEVAGRVIVEVMVDDHAAPDEQAHEHMH